MHENPKEIRAFFRLDQRMGELSIVNIDYKPFYCNQVRKCDLKMPTQSKKVRYWPSNLKMVPL